MISIMKKLICTAILTIMFLTPALADPLGPDAPEPSQYDPVTQGGLLYEFPAAMYTEWFGPRQENPSIEDHLSAMH